MTSIPEANDGDRLADITLCIMSHWKDKQKYQYNMYKVCEEHVSVAIDATGLKI